MTHLQLSLQICPRAQHWGHHFISDWEVLWEAATAADQNRVEAIQELGGEKGIFLPVLEHVLCGKVEDVGGWRTWEDQSPQLLQLRSLLTRWHSLLSTLGAHLLEGPPLVP